MFKKLLFVTIGMLLVVTAANAQWTFVKYFPDTVTIKGWASGVNNGIAVDPDGKIWIQSYAYNSSVDSLATGVYTGQIRVYYPSGTEASFSPIEILSGVDQTGASVTDTLNGSGYGLAVDPSSGNILSVKWSTRLWMIDYKTGQGIRRVANPIPGYASSLCTPAVDDLGEVFVAPVVPGNAVAILNPDFTAAGTVETASQNYSRCIAVSADGNDVYFPTFGNKQTYVYHSDNGSLGPYSLVDSILIGMTVETSVWQPKTGYLWVTSGNTTSGLPDPPWVGYRFYAYDVASKQIVDSIAVYDPLIPEYGTDPRPRGIAFNANGDTAYVACFNGTMASWVEVFAKSGAVYVQPDNNVVPTGYELSQNYPNPFNPSTTIKFSIAQSGMTTLKVFDVMGREVTTLVNESLAAGAYTVRFDGANLSSGTYLYVLTSGGHRLTGKMLLLK